MRKKHDVTFFSCCTLFWTLQVYRHSGWSASMYADLGGAAPGVSCLVHVWWDRHTDWYTETRPMLYIALCLPLDAASTMGLNSSVAYLLMSHLSALPVVVVCGLWLLCSAPAFPHDAWIADGCETVGQASVECVWQESGKCFAVLMFVSMSAYYRDIYCNYGSLNTAVIKEIPGT